MSLCAACSRDRSQSSDAGPAPPGSAVSAPTATPLPQLLFLPDGGDVAQNNRSGADNLLAPQHITAGRCPADMVDIRGSFCIDRYEAVLFDARGHRRISPYYHPTRAQTRIDHDKWQKVPALGTDAPAVPEPPSFQLREELEAVAEAQPGVVPNGY